MEQKFVYCLFCTDTEHPMVEQLVLIFVDENAANSSANKFNSRANSGFKYFVKKMEIL